LVPRERRLAVSLILIIIVSSILLIFNGYLSRTQTEPKVGGKYTEGLLGQPRYINPILSQTNDVDRDLTEVLFSSLFTYDGQGNIVPDLAQEYTVSDDHKTYEIRIRDNVTWHNGEKLTAEDVVFTVKTIQDKEYGSPLRVIWEGIDVEKADDLTVRFTIRNPYAPFLHNLTFGILPKHLWAGISGANFALADYNLFNPIGSGPYKFKKLKKNSSGGIESITLIRTDNAFIDTLVFRFYNTQEDLIKAYSGGQVDGIAPISSINQPKARRGTNVYSLNLPIYHSVFFNQTESKVLADENVRIALSHATNKQEILEKVLNNQGTIINSPILLEWLNHEDSFEDYEFNLDKAREILEENDWLENEGIREKEDDDEVIRLEINLTTTDWPELKQTAEILQQQWEAIGMQVNLDIIDPISIKQDYIQPRQYQALLFGEVLGADPDPFAFWHSSQKKDPGLNLAMYQNKDADKLLEEGRQSLDLNERIEKYQKFQEIVKEDAPAIFLYSPSYTYLVDKDVKGISLEKLPLPSQRFCQIEKWHIKTKRISK
jgi:peptide/nickel transport system substrate-binding protein